jgi:colicin import membrane protein
MHFGLAISILLHVGLLAWALFQIHTTIPRDLVDTPPVEVSMITPSELTRLKQGDPTSKELVAKADDRPPEKDVSKKEAEKPKPMTAPPPAAAEPPPPEPPKPETKAEPPKPEPPKPETKAEPPKPDPIAEKLAEPPPGPTPDELKRQEEQKQAEAAKKAEELKKLADEKKKAEEKKKADEKKKAEELKKKLAEAKRKEDEKKKFDADRIAALLDKTPDKKGAPQRSNSPDPNATHKGPTAGNPTGNDTVLSAREIDMLNGMLGAQLRRCYSLPGAGGGANIPIIELRWKMKPDGMVDGQPEVLAGGSGPLAQVAVDTAIRAVLQCQPFNLPPDKYQVWKVIERAFDPSNML